MTVAQIGPRPVDEALAMRAAGVLVSVTLFMAALECRQKHKQESVRCSASAGWMVQLFDWALLAGLDDAGDARAELHANFEAAEWLMDFIAAGRGDWSDPENVLLGKGLTAKAIQEGERVPDDTLATMLEFLNGFCQYLEQLGWES